MNRFQSSAFFRFFQDTGKLVKFLIAFPELIMETKVIFPMAARFSIYSYSNSEVQHNK